MDNRRFLLCVGIAISLLAFDSCKAINVPSKGNSDPTDVSASVAETGPEPVGITAVCPQAELYLPDYPAFEDREAFYNDSILYERGKEYRGTPRGEVALADVSTSLEYYLSRFGEVMGVCLSKDSTAAVAAYVETTFAFARSGISNAKNAYHRLRPYRHFGEPSGVPGRDMGFDAYQSYPSGHSVRAWAIALALVAIDEEHQYEIIKTGYELGESRVIVGYHYESDVEAARLAASVAFARLVTDKYYMKLMDKAKSELDSLKAQMKTAI